MVKSGTPTMGGLLVILVVLGIFLLLRWPVQGGVIAPLATLALVGLLGAADDYLNARTGEGIRARQKLLWQTVVAFVVAFQIQTTYDITAIRVPFVGDVAIDPVVYIFFAAFAIVAASNGVNITDGLDGLAGGTLAFAFVSFMIIALLNVPAQPNIAFLCALIIGALLGFLWFNVHPAQVFMGDSGSLSLGAVLAVIALITGQILVLPIIGLIFVVETMSDIIQIGYFKALRRQAGVPDGAAPPPLRAGRLGRGEDHAPVLDRGHPRGPPGRHAVHGLDQCARLTWPSDPIDLDALAMADIRAGALDGPPGHRARPRPERHRARPVPARHGRPRDGLRRPRRRRSSSGAIAQLGGRAVTLRLGPDVDPASTWAGRRPRHHLAVDHARLPDDRAAPPGGAAGARGRPRGRRSGRPGARLASPTCSCGSARRPRSA